MEGTPSGAPEVRKMMSNKVSFLERSAPDSKRGSCCSMRSDSDLLKRQKSIGSGEWQASLQQARRDDAGKSDTHEYADELVLPKPILNCQLRLEHEVEKLIKQSAEDELSYRTNYMRAISVLISGARRVDERKAATAMRILLKIQWMFRGKRR
jgi:hypothetical protein